MQIHTHTHSHTHIHAIKNMHTHSNSHTHTHAHTYTHLSVIPRGVVWVLLDKAQHSIQTWVLGHNAVVSHRVV